jgi:hypothetical protein
VPPKTFTPAQTGKILVEGFGVNDSVAVLPVGTSPTNVSIGLANRGSGTVSGAYAVREVIEVFALRSPPVRFEPVDTVFDAVFPGPTPIAAGDTAAFSAAVTVPATCGLYRETLIADTADAVDESDETNNRRVDWFFIPSNQQFNIMVNVLDDDITHEMPVNTHTFTVTASFVPPVDSVFLGGFTFVATAGDLASIDLAPGKYPLPLVIQMTVTPRTHVIPGGFAPTVTGKVTVISKDGCVVKQQTARVAVQHEVS